MNSECDVFPQVQLSSVSIQLELEPWFPNLDSSTLVAGQLCLSSFFFFFFFFFSKMYFADCSLYYFHNQPLDAVIVINSTQQRNIVPLLQNWIMTLGHLQDKPLDKVLGCTTGNPQIQCRPC